MVVVNLENPVPKYLQISQWLKELIESGRFKGGEKLPSEVELSKMCDVNRNTLRQAIAELVSEGRLKKVKGVGSFVREAPYVELHHDISKIASFKDYFGSANLEEKTIVLEMEPMVAEKKIAERLLLGAERRVILLKRLRTGDGAPFIYEESFLPYNLFKDLTVVEASGSLYKAITEKFGIELVRSRQVVRAVNLSKKIATMFNLPENSAGLLMENITYDRNNTPVELLFSYSRGDKYVMELELGEYQPEK
ncbi:MAG: GntR family transcriptional regulator [Desulfobacteraceae bacterium]|nr:GntR family transcriptional regulator [Desulfobacteraceae bacterium]